jgi:hypothetical protein
MTNLSYVSDELTHFLGRSLSDHQSRYALLREILRTGWLKASHRDQLYHAALDHPAGQRAAFLQEACSDDTLRREVESLLASDRADDTVLDSPAWERRLSPGDCIGPYQIISRIGAGYQPPPPTKTPCRRYP